LRLYRLLTEFDRIHILLEQERVDTRHDPTLARGVNATFTFAREPGPLAMWIFHGEWTNIATPSTCSTASTQAEAFYATPWQRELRDGPS